MNRLARVFAVVVVGAAIGACDAWRMAMCDQEQSRCEHQSAACHPPGPGAPGDPPESNVELKVFSFPHKLECVDTAAMETYSRLHLHDQGRTFGQHAELEFEADEDLCYLTFEVRVDEYDPKLERDVLVGGADARVRLCHASFEISHAPSYGELAPQLTGASILSGGGMTQLLQDPVGLPIVEREATPTGCAEPVADRGLDDVYYGWDLEVVLTITELQRLFGGGESPSLRTTWLIEELP